MAVAVSAKEAETMTSQSATQDRVNTLETHIAHQEKLIEELSEVTAKQWQEISALSNQLERLSDKLKAIEGGMEVKSGDEPSPPHY